MPNEELLKKSLWTEEFSVHASEDKYVLRRQFTKFLVLTSFGMFVGNAWIFVRSLFRRAAPVFPQTAVANASAIPIGGVKLFSYPGPNDPCILVHTNNDRFVAYSQKCTHLSCAVYYSKDHNRLECPCHEGYFAVEDGRVLQGPPPRPLQKIEIERRGDQLVAVRVISEEDGGASGGRS